MNSWKIRNKQQSFNTLLAGDDFSGHMTKMAATPIYGKNPLKSSPEAGRWWPWELVCSVGDVGPSKFVQMMILGWPWPT